MLRNSSISQRCRILGPDLSMWYLFFLAYLSTDSEWYGPRPGEYSSRVTSPTVGVARFGSKVSDGLSSISEEPTVGMKNLLVYSF